MKNEAQNEDERGCRRLCPDCPMRNNNDLKEKIDQDQY